LDEWIWQEHKRFFHGSSQTPFSPAGIASISSKEQLLYLLMHFIMHFTLNFEIIRNHFWYICNQFEPKEEDYHKIFNTLIFAFDGFLAIVDRKTDIVPFVERSGQANVEVEEDSED